MNRIHVDIMELNAIKFSSYRGLMHSSQSLVRCYFSFIVRLLYWMLRFRWKLPHWKDLLFVAPTLNNRKALEPIWVHFSEDNYMVLYNLREQLPYSRIYFLSMLHLFDFHRTYCKVPEKDKPLVKYFFSDFILAYGTYITIRQILKKNSQLKVIVFSNDHNMVNRCLIELAPSYHIKTLYTQHASITERFPSLLFSYSFLDGLDAFNKYKTIGSIVGKVFLSGNPRFDIISRLKKNNGKAIGIAINIHDDIDILKNVCSYLSENVNEEIIIRPHPSLEQIPVWNDFSKAGYLISYPSKENSFEFVGKLRLLIANESSIHLDSNLMDTPSVLYNFSMNPVMDWYSYVKNGLMPICSTKEELLKYIQSGGKMDVERVRYYNAAFNTSYEGRVGIVIADFVKCMLQDIEMNSVSGVFHLHKDGYYCYV